MSFMSKMVEILENQAKSKTLVYLRTVSEQQQIDYGFSPALIKQGVKAWPWKTLPENADLPQIDKLTNLTQVSGDTKPKSVPAKKRAEIHKNAA